MAVFQTRRRLRPLARRLSRRQRGEDPPWGRTSASSASQPDPTVTLRAKAVLEPAQIQDLADAMADLLNIKGAADAPLVFQIQIDYGDAKNPPTPEATTALNEKLEAVKQGLRLG